jgi:hypothetical protein
VKIGTTNKYRRVVVDSLMFLIGGFLSAYAAGYIIEITAIKPFSFAGVFLFFMFSAIFFVAIVYLIGSIFNKQRIVNGFIAKCFERFIGSLSRVKIHSSDSQDKKKAA